MVKHWLKGVEFERVLEMLPFDLTYRAVYARQDKEMYISFVLNVECCKNFDLCSIFVIFKAFIQKLDDIFTCIEHVRNNFVQFVI